jgi:hypothetical protein
MMILKFDEFILEKSSIKKKKKKKKKEKPNAGVYRTEMRKQLLKRYRKFGKKWVCLIVTDKTKREYEINYPGKPFDIMLGSHRILLNTNSQFEKAKIKYQIGNLYKKEETIIDINYHPYNPLIDSVFFGEQKIR